MKNRKLLTLALLTGLLGGCAGLQPRSESAGPAAGRVITGAQLQEMGATSAWDGLRRGGIFYSMSETPAGEPLGMSVRGSAARVAAGPLIDVDGSLTPEFGVLRDIPAHLVDEIRVLGATAATIVYGAAAGNGAIVVRTRRG